LISIRYTPLLLLIGIPRDQVAHRVFGRDYYNHRQHHLLDRIRLQSLVVHGGADHVWWVAGTCSKIFNLPIYRKVKKLDENQTEELINERRKLQTANYVRAYLTFVCVVLMVIALA
jgi:hypothetical protein